MSGSKGGHSAKDEEESFKKYMISVENHDMDSRTIIDILREHRVNPDYESGIEYTLKVVRNVYPGEVVFGYQSEEERNERYNKLKSKMQMLGIIFI